MKKNNVDLSYEVILEGGEVLSNELFGVLDSFNIPKLFDIYKTIASDIVKQHGKNIVEKEFVFKKGSNSYVIS